MAFKFRMTQATCFAFSSILLLSQTTSWTFQFNGSIILLTSADWLQMTLYLSSYPLLSQVKVYCYNVLSGETLTLRCVRDVLQKSGEVKWCLTYLRKGKKSQILIRHLVFIWLMIVKLGKGNLEEKKFLSFLTSVKKQKQNKKIYFWS